MANWTFIHGLQYSYYKGGTKWRVKIPVGDPSEIRSPLGMGTGEIFFATTRNEAGTEGRDLSRDGDGKYVPHLQTHPVAILRCWQRWHQP